VSALQCRLDAAGLHVPERVDGAGRRCGGKPFSRGHLYKILTNPIYIGRLSHRGKTYDGQHPAIVEGGGRLAKRILKMPPQPRKPPPSKLSRAAAKPAKKKEV